MELKEKRNSEIFLRPRFSIDIEKNHKETRQKIVSFLNSESCQYINRIVDNHVIIDIPKNRSHFWSPQLNFEIIENGKNSTKIKGLFGPKPQVWTLFMFIHFIIAIMFLGFVVMAYVKHRLGENLFFPLSMLITLPFIWVLLYFLGSVGKDTGKDQMKELHHLMITVLED